MNLLLVADLHYTLKQFDWLVSVAADHDAVVIAGDLLEVGSVVPQGAQIVVVTEYLRRLSGITTVLVCSGNHDLDAELPGGERIAGWLVGLGVAEVVRDGQAVVIGDTLLSCFPWWEGAETRAAIAAQMASDAARRTGPWIRIHHAPPSESPVSWGGRRSYGDRRLRAGSPSSRRPSSSPAMSTRRPSSKAGPGSTGSATAGCSTWASRSAKPRPTSSSTPTPARPPGSPWPGRSASP